MKIAKKDIALVMVLVAVIAAFCAYKFSMKSNLDKVEDEESKQAVLQQQIDEVKARADQVPKMEKEIGEWQSNVSNWLKPFHSAHIYEDGIMYLRNLEHQDEKAEEEAFKAFILEYKLNETGIESTVNGQGSFGGIVFNSGTAKYNFAYRLTGYQQLKNFISYIISEEDGFGVKSLDKMSYELTPGSDLFIGNIEMTAYAISEIDNGKVINPYVPQDLSEIEQGLEKDSIFGDFVEEDENGNNNNNDEE